MRHCVRNHSVGKNWKLKTAVMDAANPSRGEVKNCFLPHSLQTLKHSLQTTSNHLSVP